MKKVFLLFLCVVAMMNTSLAQKFGHLNYGNLLEQMPEVKTANGEMETYQKQLSVKGEDMMKALEAKYTAYKTEADGGNLSQMQLQQKEAELQKDNQAIEAYRSEVQDLLTKKREELLSPILTKIQDAVNAIGKENSYTFIFDVSLPNTILYANDSDDIMPLVKKKLGLL